MWPWSHRRRWALTLVKFCLDACPEKSCRSSRSSTSSLKVGVWIGGGVVTAGASRARLAPADKYDQRRNELAESALRTLGERGYTRTSLREIATNSEFSHGVVHYYFADKLELIVYCVRYYK